MFLCYQCGKCSSGCPTAYIMDLLPHEVVKLGMEEVLRLGSIWFCTSCGTCLARCPREVGLKEVMEALKRLCRREDVRPVMAACRSSTRP